jgi:hypothetical protein
MSSAKDESHLDFNAIMADSGLHEYSGEVYVLTPRALYVDEIDKMADEICYELDYAELDPDKAKAYRDFVARSWREHGYKPRRVEKIRAKAFQVMGFDEGTK